MPCRKSALTVLILSPIQILNVINSLSGMIPLLKQCHLNGLVLKGNVRGGGGEGTRIFGGTF